MVNILWKICEWIRLLTPEWPCQVPWWLLYSCRSGSFLARRAPLTWLQTIFPLFTRSPTGIFKLGVPESTRPSVNLAVVWPHPRNDDPEGVGRNTQVLCCHQAICWYVVIRSSTSHPIPCPQRFCSHQNLRVSGLASPDFLILLLINKDHFLQSDCYTLSVQCKIIIKQPDSGGRLLKISPQMPRGKSLKPVR